MPVVNLWRAQEQIEGGEWPPEMPKRERRKMIAIGWINVLAGDDAFRIMCWADDNIDRLEKAADWLKRGWVLCANEWVPVIVIDVAQKAQDCGEDG